MKYFLSKWGMLCATLAAVIYAKITGNYEALVFPMLFGTVDRVAGQPDYTQDGANKNIPWAFSRKTIVKFYDSSVIPQVANTDYEGEIKSMGDKVVIMTIPTVTINRYKKGKTITWENLESPGVEMPIDQAIDFAFKLDKVDIKQFGDKGYMDKAAQDAAEQQKIFIDTDFLNSTRTGNPTSTAANGGAAAANRGLTAGRKSSSYNLGTTGSGITLTKTNIIDKLLELTGVAEEQNWPESDRYIVLPTIMTVLLKQSDLKDASLTGDSSSTLRTGRIGMLDKWTIYSTNLYNIVSDTGSYYNILFGHISATSFATQLIETEFFEKLETTFGSGMKGLQVYDWKVTKPEACGVLYAKKG